MNIIKIEIETRNKKYLITEGIEEINSNRELKSFLINFLGADFTLNDKILIPYTSETKEEVINKLNKILSRYGFKEKHSDEMDAVLESFT